MDPVVDPVEVVEQAPLLLRYKFHFIQSGGYTAPMSLEHGLLARPESIKSRVLLGLWQVGQVLIFGCSEEALGEGQGERARRPSSRSTPRGPWSPMAITSQSPL